MALISENVQPTFNLEEIGKGWLIHGKHSTWDEGKAGIVTSAKAMELVVQFYPNIENVTNHYFIRVDEVVDGQWEIRWSKDLSEVFEYDNSETDDTSVDGNGAGE